MKFRIGIAGNSGRSIVRTACALKSMAKNSQECCGRHKKARGLAATGQIPILEKCDSLAQQCVRSLPYCTMTAHFSTNKQARVYPAISGLPLILENAARTGHQGSEEHDELRAGSKELICFLSELFPFASRQNRPLQQGEANVPA